MKQGKSRIERESEPERDGHEVELGDVGGGHVAVAVATIERFTIAIWARSNGLQENRSAESVMKRRR